MKRLALALSAAALLFASAPAFADGNRHESRGYSGHSSKSYGHGYKRHGYGPRSYKNRSYKNRGYGRRGYGYRGRKSYDYGPAIAGALAGGVVLGHLLSQPSYRTQNNYAPAAQPYRRDCHATTGTHTYQGRTARYGGTMCYDSYGRGYIAPGSRYFMGYLY